MARSPLPPPKPTLRLDNDHRMKKTYDFGLVRREGETKGGKFLVMGVKKDNPEAKNTTFGFVTSKKVSKKAVIRNKVRRRMRELVRAYGGFFPEGSKVTVVARYTSSEATFSQLRADFLGLMRRLGHPVPTDVWKEARRLDATSR